MPPSACLVRRKCNLIQGKGACSQNMPLELQPERLTGFEEQVLQDEWTTHGDNCYYDDVIYLLRTSVWFFFHVGEAVVVLIAGKYLHMRRTGIPALGYS